jgi:5-(carboxyamino)imidazole ribonucleotide synthase
MLLQAAANLNLDIHLLDPDPQAPCRALTPQFEVGSLTDEETVYAFGSRMDLITIEIENVNVRALERLEAEGKKVYPEPRVLRLIQDKRLQKQFYAEHNLPTAPFALIDHPSQLIKYTSWLPAYLKLGREGYDGKGVMRLSSPTDYARAFEAPSLIEQAAPVAKELAVIVARNAQGQTACYPAVEMVFDPQYNLVDYLLAPAQIDEATAAAAQALAVTVIEKLAMTGLLAVEMFLTLDGELWVNEVAPRTHNSGHSSIEGNVTSQFEQHLRAILNLPLGSTKTRSLAAMVNLIGAEGYQGTAYYQGLEEVLALEEVYLHLYGKTITKPGRKMGHITLTADSVEALQQKIAFIKKTLRVISQ